MAIRSYLPKLKLLGGIMLPGSAGTGKVLTSDTEGNGTWTAIPKKKIRTAHAWVDPASVAAATETRDGPVVRLAAGEEQLVVAIDYKIRTGTSCTFKLQHNGVDIPGFTALVAKETTETKEPAAFTLAAGEEITLVITAISGEPKGLKVSMSIEHVA